MKYDDLRKKLFKKLAVSGAAVALALPVMVYLYLMQDSIESDYDKVKSDISSIESGYKKARNNMQNASGVFEEYENLPADRLPLTSSDAMEVTSRIREARLPLQELKERYRLSNLDMSLTAPAELAGEMKKDKISGASSKVTLKFSALTDELALSFIDALIAEFPGYVRIDFLSMKRNGGEINDAMLSKVRAGTMPSIIDVTLVFYWIKLKDNSVVAHPIAPVPQTIPVPAIPPSAAKPAG